MFTMRDKHKNKIRIVSDAADSVDIIFLNSVLLKERDLLKSAYMERNNLLTNYQLGFKRNFSCETKVNYLTNRWKFIGRKKKYGNIFRFRKRI